MTRVKSALALVGLAILVGGAALAAVNPVWRDTPQGKAVLNGEWTQSFGSAFDKALLIREPSVAAWATASFVLFGEARPGALVGTGGWLYTEEEFDAVDPAASVARTLTFAREAQRRLAARGVRLVVMLVPAKARIHPEHLGGTRWPERLTGVYASLSDGLERSGIDVVDVARAMRTSREPMFYRTDTHWSSAGAALAARAAAERLRVVAPDIVPGPVRFALVTGKPQEHRGDLLTYLPMGRLGARYMPAPDPLVPVTAEGDTGGGLLGDADTPVLLVGTSYSANAKWGFESRLKAATGIDIVNAAREGDGPFAPLRDIVGDATIAETGARVVLWELPERYVWMKGKLGPPERWSGVR